jgi:hypothetical protein
LNDIKAGFINFAAASLETMNTLFSQIGQGCVIIGQKIAAGVTTPVGGAWQWIVQTWNAAVAGISTGETTALITAFVTTAVGGAWQWITSTFVAAVDGMKTKIDQGKAWVTEFVTTTVPGAWDWIVDKWNQMLQKLGIKGGSSGGAPAAAPTGMAGGGLLGGRGSGTSDSNLAWVSRGEYITPARIVQQPGVLAFLEALRRSGHLPRFAGGGLVPSFAEGGQVDKDKVVSVMSGVRQLVDGVQQTLARLTFTMIDGMRGVMKDIDKLMREFSDVVNGLIAGPLKDASDKLFDFEESLKGHARGGLLGGRGTGTSDSNLAWVSRGEHIMPARAVAQPGVLAFLEALRRSGGNLRNVFDGMGRFALGGLVRGPIGIPAFAGGGMSNVTIAFPGLPEITGLRASSAVVDELRKAAALAQVRSGGRKPSRYS